VFEVVLFFRVPFYFFWSLERSDASAKKLVVLFTCSLSCKLGMDEKCETWPQLLDLNMGNSSIPQVSDEGCVFGGQQQMMLWDCCVACSSEQVQLYRAGR